MDCCCCVLRGGCEYGTLPTVVTCGWGGGGVFRVVMCFTGGCSHRFFAVGLGCTLRRLDVPNQAEIDAAASSCTTASVAQPLGRPLPPPPAARHGTAHGTAQAVYAPPPPSRSARSDTGAWAAHHGAQLQTAEYGTDGMQLGHAELIVRADQGIVSTKASGIHSCDTWTRSSCIACTSQVVA